MSGALYVLAAPLVEWITANEAVLKTFGNEDATVGIWMSILANVTYEHESRVQGHPNVCFSKQWPNLVIYHELSMGTREYMKCVTQIEERWLLESLPSTMSRPEAIKSSFKVDAAPVPIKRKKRRKRTNL